MNYNKSIFGIKNRMIKDEYYDMTLNNELCENDLFVAHNNTPYYDCLISSINFTNPNFSGNSIVVSDSAYTYSNAYNYGIALNHIGLTGVDNGTIQLSGTTKLFSGITVSATTDDSGNTITISAITYSSSLTNNDILDVYSGSTLSLFSGDTKLYLHQVTGYTGNYIYPILDFNLSGTTISKYKQFVGGFYQGFIKLQGYDYQILPLKPEIEWGFEFWINKNEAGYIPNGTLNEKYPNNKGIILYLGARAEDKFYNTFSGETGFTLDNGMVLNPPIMTENVIDNKFELFNRTEYGQTVCSFNPDVDYVFTAYTKVNKYENTNYFELFDRTCSGLTVCELEASKTYQDTINFYKDICDNNFCIQINDDGSIGYKILTHISGLTIDEVNSLTGLTIQEEFSLPNVISGDTWQHLFIRYIPETTLSETNLTKYKQRDIKLFFYVNGRLKFITKSFKEPLFREFQNNKEKVEGVPFNISIGGGSQGLIDSITLNGPDYMDYNLPIETNFAGTFIGGIGKFNFYDCKMDYTKIYNNYKMGEEFFANIINYPIFATINDINILSEISQSIIENGYIELTLIGESNTNKQTIDIPYQLGEIFSIKMYNTFSGNWEWLSGNENNSLITFTKSNVSHEIYNTTIPYLRYEHNGSKIGSRKLRFYLNYNNG